MNCFPVYRQLKVSTSGSLKLTTAAAQTAASLSSRHALHQNQRSTLHFSWWSQLISFMWVGRVGWWNELTSSLQIQLAFFKKEGNDYHQFFRIPPLEWCGLMAGAKSNNRLTRPIVASLKELMPQIVKPCPFQGKMEIYDLSLGRKSLFNMYPTGVFRVEFKAFQTDPDCTITGNVWIEVMNW